MREKLNGLTKKLGNWISPGLGDTLVSPVRIDKIDGITYIVIAKNNSQTYTIINSNNDVSKGSYKVLEGQCF